LATKAGAGDEASWVKVCTKDEKTDDRQVCLIKHEGLEPKTGTILIAAAVRTTEGDEKHYLLVNVPTSYSLVMPAGVQIKVDEGEPIQLQYSVCLPTNCQVQMEVSKEMLDKMRKGKQMFVAAMNARQKTMAFPIPLKGFAKTSDGPPVNNAAYQEARNQMMQAARQRQNELAKQAAEARQAGGQSQAPPPAAAAPAAPPPPQ
jgi:invasion protein IalB